MDYFAAVRAFICAAERRSFSQAAQQLAIKTSTVSRYVSELEKDLSIALFNRSTRGLVLTEGGRVFREHALRALDALDEARHATSSLNLIPQGVLRATVPGAFGRHHVAPHLPAFKRRYPDIDVDLIVTDAVLNLIDARIDVAIRIGALSDSSLMARRLATHRRIVCGSPDYFRRCGTPTTPQELATHESVRLALQPDDRWLLTPTVPSGTAASAQTAVGLKGGLRADDSEIVLELALAGCGIALLPTWLVSAPLRDGRLTQVLPDWEARTGQAEPAVWAVYPPKKTVSSKVRAFVDFFAEVIGEPPYWNSGPTSHDA